MFRELTRKNKEIPFEECIKILENERRGVLCVTGDEGYPYGTPMNHFYNADNGKIYFHCGRCGHRLDALRKDNKASFTTYTDGYREGDEWALRVKSVIVFGKIEIIDDISTIIDISTKLSHKFTQDDEHIKNEIDAHAKNTYLLCLTPEHICGKSVVEA